VLLEDPEQGQQLVVRERTTGRGRDTELVSEEGRELGGE
jgi:hypothetical protein